MKIIKFLFAVLVGMLVWLVFVYVVNEVNEIPTVSSAAQFGGDVSFIVQKDENSPPEYYTLNLESGRIAAIPPFENQAKIFVSPYTSFSAHAENGKIVQELVNTELYDLNGSPAEDAGDPAIIRRIFEKTAEIGHSVMRLTVIYVEGKYFAQADLNVNWQSPNQVYYYDPARDSFEKIHTFQHMSIIGAQLVDAEAFAH